MTNEQRKIDALMAENAALRNELYQARVGAAERSRYIAALQKKVDALKADDIRLREKLGQISDQWDDGGNWDNWSGIEHIWIGPDIGSMALDAVAISAGI